MEAPALAAAQKALLINGHEVAPNCTAFGSQLLRSVLSKRGYVSFTSKKVTLNHHEAFTVKLNALFSKCPISFFS